MTAKLLDGKTLARQIQSEIAEDIADFVNISGVRPVLAVVLVGDDPASTIYVRNKTLVAERVGIEGRLLRLSAETNQASLLDQIERLNADPAVHGVLVQMPLPGHIDPAAVLAAVDPLKDVDAFHPENVGRLVQGRPRFLPCTPAGIVQLLTRSGVELAGRHVVIVGRSDIVGKPLANMLVQRGVDATVTLCHSRTPDLGSFTRQADIVVVAAGRPKLLTANMVRAGAVVVDVGMNRLAEGLVGDVDFEGVRQVASLLTPVPGGVGPLTVTMLMLNTLAAARLQRKQ